MRYEYRMLPPAPGPLRRLRAIRALFQHPGRALMIGLLLLLVATQLSAQQNPAQIDGRVVLEAKVRAGVGDFLAYYDRTGAAVSEATMRRVMALPPAKARIP